MMFDDLDDYEAGEPLPSGAVAESDDRSRPASPLPPTEYLAGTADPEYKARIAADQATWQFSDSLRPQKPQASIEDLPLFGGERQGELF